MSAQPTGASTPAISTRVEPESCRASTHSSSSFFFQAEDGIRDRNVTGVQTCALPISKEALTLLNSSLRRADSHPGGSIVATVIGFVLAAWAVTGAMNSYMTALDLAYNREKDTRSFLKRRVTALKMAAVLGLAFVLVAVLLMFGPVVESAIARRVGGAGAFVGIAWWVAQWPILLGGLLFAFAAVLYLGPDVKHAEWE